MLQSLLLSTAPAVSAWMRPGREGSVTQRVRVRHGSVCSQERLVTEHGWRGLRLRLTAWRREQTRVSARGLLVAPTPMPVPTTVCHALPCPHLAMAPGAPSCYLSSRLARIGAR